MMRSDFHVPAARIPSSSALSTSRRLASAEEAREAARVVGEAKTAPRRRRNPDIFPQKFDVYMRAQLLLLCAYNVGVVKSSALTAMAKGDACGVLCREDSEW